MNRVGIALVAATAAIASACTVHRAPKDPLKPRGEHVELRLASGQSAKGEALSVDRGRLLLEIESRIYAVPIAAIRSARFEDFAIRLEPPTAEKLVPYCRWPQGLTAEQWATVLRAFDQVEALPLSARR